jgi:hypothetical protein
VHIYLEKIPDQATRHTYVIIAGDIFQPLPMIKPELSVTRKWYNITSQILDNGTPINKLPLLTDDFSPVDRLLHKVLLKIE